MVRHALMTFTPANRRMILVLISGHLLWSGGLFCLWSTGGLIETALPFWTSCFILLQLFAAAQLQLPTLILSSEERSRGFYLFWGVSLGMTVWLINQLTPVGLWQPLLEVLKSGLLLLVATLVGGVLARYVKKLWEILPVCIVMTLADLGSWMVGPTAHFTAEIKRYYLDPKGVPPIIDMALIKLAFPGGGGLAPAFGISDWIMVVFFIMVNRRFGIDDNLIGPAAATLAKGGQIGRYLPLSVVALFVALLLARSTGLFLPGLPVIALIMLLWYAGRFLLSDKDKE